jgi:translation elongation factor EF-Tu-like GTPase
MNLPGTPLHRLYKQPDDFEAVIRIFTSDEGGRRTPPFNGIRWDFAYSGDDVKTTGLSMIWPDFVDEAGNSLPIDQALPIGLPLEARMTVVVDEMRAKLHRARISVGTEFFCHEGTKRVAAGAVTKITGLFADRSPTQRSMG